MGLRPMGKVPDLRRLAGRVAPRSTVPRSWPWTFPGFSFLAAVVGVPRVGWNQTPAVLGRTARNRLGATGPSSGKSRGGVIRLGDTVSSSTQNCESCK